MDTRIILATGLVAKLARGKPPVRNEVKELDDMRRKLYPINVLSRAKNIAVAWEKIGPTVTFGKLDNTAFHNDITQADIIEAKIRHAQLELAALRNERDALYLSLWDKVKRVYASVKGIYGDDSTQYEMVGRTRASKRKRRSRKVVAG